MHEKYSLLYTKTTFLDLYQKYFVTITKYNVYNTYIIKLNHVILNL